MGYTVDWWGHLNIKKGHMEEIKKIIDKSEKEGEESPFHWLGCELQEKDNTLFFGESGNYHEEYWDTVLEIISPHVEGTIDFTGESSEFWREEIKDGKRISLSGEIVYGNLDGAFLEKYKESLPKHLKTELEKWQIARRI